MIDDGYLLGLDIGSSSVKASLISISTGQTVVSAQSPSEEMTMIAQQPGWAEQDPELWWTHVVVTTRECLRRSSAAGASVKAIGIAYQMHGLVMVDKHHRPLRNSIIWCDSRAVSVGATAFDDLGKQYSLEHLLNSPGNFTASKLKWVQVNEPEIYSRIYKVMLPGDYIAMKLSGEIATTDTGLSEGTLWDFKNKSLSSKLLDYYQFDASIIAPSVPVFSIHARVDAAAAATLGISAGTPISYRAGDQPNNAFSLNVLNPGETAANAGTSGVIYSVTDKNVYDPESRVNAFLHVNNSETNPRNGILLCVNGTGIQNSWLRKILQANGSTLDYPSMNTVASGIAIGSDGVSVLPFGNGAERILGNREIGASIHGLNFNRHHSGHLFRAVQEGIVYALNYGFEILEEIGATPTVIRAGSSNMFLSPVFREAFANTIGARVELYDTDGAKGAAIGAGVGAGIYKDHKEAFRGLHCIGAEEPTQEKRDAYATGYDRWKKQLLTIIEKES